MRFIIHELPYETPLTAGQWNYMLHGQATGALEQWRLTEAVDGYRFLRVDLDARAAHSGRSTLYHLTLDEQGNPVHLKYRLWIDGLQIIGTVLIEEDAVIVTRETAGERQEDVIKVPAGYGFWFPATAGLSLLTGLVGSENRPAVMLQTTAADPALLMSPILTKVTIHEAAPSTVEVLGKEESARRLSINWEDQQRKLWVDDEGWPLKMKRNDGLTAVTTRAIKYQRIIEPGVNPNQQHNAA
jgi:hypothetical protein